MAPGKQLGVCQLISFWHGIDQAGSHRRCSAHQTPRLLRMEMTSNPLGADADSAAGGADPELGAELKSLKASHADLAKKVALLEEAGASADVRAVVAKMGTAPTNWHQVRT